MVKYRIFALCLIVTGLFYACQSPEIDLQAENLKLDHCGWEGVRQLCLSWTMNASSPRGLNQQAYRIRIASRPELLEQNSPDIWDSGKVSSSKNYDVPYKGKALERDTVYYAQIRIWTNRGKSLWSKQQNLVLPAEGDLLPAAASINRFDTYDLKLSDLVQAYKTATLEKYKHRPQDLENMSAADCWAESYLIDNRTFYLQWMDRLLAAQAEDGSLPLSAQQEPQEVFDLAHMLLLQYNETAHLKKHFPAMEKWLDFLWKNYGSQEYILTADGEGHTLLPAEKCSLDGKEYTTSAALISTAYFYRLCVLMEKFSSHLQYRDKAAHYADWAGKLRKAYNGRFFNEEKQYYENNTPTANLLSLSLGFCEDKRAENVFKRIEQSIAIEHYGKAACGEFGKRYLYRTLSAWGRSDLSYRLGAELLEVEGDFILWFFEHLCGLKSLEEGFHCFSLDAVFPPGIYFAKTRMETRGGIISSSWIKTFDEFVWQVIVPVNTRARLRYPAAAAKDIYDDGRVIDQVEGIQILGRENGNILMELGSGDYFFSSKLADIKPGPRKFISNP